MNDSTQALQKTPGNDLRPAAKDFTKGSVPEHLVRLTSFMVLGLVSVLGASLVETIYIGRVGTLELAALGFTFPLVMIFQGISMGLGIGASSVIARAMGQGDSDTARKLITHGLVLTMIIILVAIGLVYNVTGLIFDLLGADEYTRPLAVEYMDVWLSLIHISEPTRPY